MTKDQFFSDEELVAFLDDECEPEARRQIEASLEKSSDLRTRMEKLYLEKGDLKVAFDGLLQDAPPMMISDDLLDAVHTEPSKSAPQLLFGWKKVAAVALLALGLGALSSNIYTARQQDNWQSYVATYQALYGKQTLAHINLSDAAAVSELERVFSTIDKDVSLSDLRSFGSLDYKRSQILVFKDRPLVQITFLSTAGQPVALCIMRSRNNEVSPTEHRVMEGMQSSRWTQNGYDYFLIGTDDPKLTEAAAKHFSSIL